MALGQWFGWIGAFIGGIIGFFIGGPLLGLAAMKGAFLGATIGFALGGLFAPTTPDVKSPDQPSDELQLPSNTIGAMICDGLGTVKVVGGQLLFYGNSRAEPQYKETIVKGKNNNIITLIGYKYYLSWGIGILAGPVNTLYTILKDDEEVIWEGELNRPGNGQPIEITIEGKGKVVFFFGTGDQNPDGRVGNLISDPELNTPYRGLCWAYFHDNCIGNYNRMPTLGFVIHKSPVFAFSNKQIIQALDYNPMHAVWYILSYLSKLPESWLHDEDFAAVAQTLYSESRGISTLLSSQQSALNWLESINGHIGNIFRYGSDGKFHPKLIRDDYPEELPIVDESIVLDKPEFNRKSWIDTINEIKVQYSEITGRPILPPSSPYLIGWYKFDEGSGLIAYNSAIGGGLGGGLLPNLIVVDGGNFWDFLPGFGSTPIRDNPVDFAYNTFATRTYGGSANGYATFGGFCRPKPLPATLGNRTFFNLGAHNKEAVYSWPGDGWVDDRIAWGGTGGISTLPNIAVYPGGEWLFYYITDTRQLARVRSDGTRQLGNIITMAIANQILLLEVGVETPTNPAFGAEASYGDIIIYNFTMLTDAQWAEWYDKLRLRYGMSERSGW